MASLCRSAAFAAARSVASRSKSALPSALPKPLPSGRATPLLTRSITGSVVGMTESLLPLHSAIASARLKSCIALDSSCWSPLSLRLALPS